MAYGKRVYSDRVCIVCNANFKGWHHKEKYCSLKCKKKNQEESKNQKHFTIFRRDNFSCVYCGKSSIEDNVKLVIDHVYPQTKGGRSTLLNLVTSCSNCNSIKNSCELSMEVIIRIWKRNEDLNKKFNESYSELENYFKKYFKDA
jgi:5-methylcytosine-specific restriction endonuclease McrA